MRLREAKTCFPESLFGTKVAEIPLRFGPFVIPGKLFWIECETRLIAISYSADKSDPEKVCPVALKRGADESR